MFSILQVTISWVYSKWILIEPTWPVDTSLVQLIRHLRLSLLEVLRPAAKLLQLFFSLDITHYPTGLGRHWICKSFMYPSRAQTLDGHQCSPCSAHPAWAEASCHRTSLSVHKKKREKTGGTKESCCTNGLAQSISQKTHWFSRGIPIAYSNYFDLHNRYEYCNFCH